MKTIQLGKHSVDIFDSIEDLPMIRFHKYNKMLLVDAGIGSDLADVDAHIQKAIAYAKSKTPELAVIELDNLRQNIYFIQSGISPRHLAFCVLVKSIDGIEQNDLSTEALQKMLELFADVTQQDITAQMEAVKKKIDEQLQLYFPKSFDDATVKEYYDELKRRTILVLQTIVSGETDNSIAEIERISTLLLTYNKPHIFTGTDNTEIQHDKSFENMCLLIAQHLHTDAKKFTVLEFYNSFEYIKEMLKPANNGKKAK